MALKQIGFKLLCTTCNNCFIGWKDSVHIQGTAGMYIFSLRLDFTFVDNLEDTKLGTFFLTSFSC